MKRTCPHCNNTIPPAWKYCDKPACEKSYQTAKVKKAYNKRYKQRQTLKTRKQITCLTCDSTGLISLTPFERCLNCNPPTPPPFTNLK